MEITSSGVSVYEVVIDLHHWDGVLSNQVAGFAEALMRLMPSTARHKCVAGQEGGFHEQLRSGTNFGHVVEHVLLELIRLARPDDPEYSGWTKPLGDGRYMIHYGAPDFLTGRLAAILAVEIVSRLQQGDEPDIDACVDELRNPMDYFCRRRGSDPTGGGALRMDLADAFAAEAGDRRREPPPGLDDWQRNNLIRNLTLVEPELPAVRKRWEEGFVAFGGEFARGILDKVELLNADRYRGCFVKGDFAGCFEGVTNIGRMLRSLRIPQDFAAHSAWLYKNALQLAMLRALDGDTEAQTAAVADLDDFYQNVLHAVTEGYRRPAAHPLPDEQLTLCGFRARHARRGAVLVVDDDQMVRRVACDILQNCGFAAVDARDGVEALHLLAENGHDIGVVLLDLVMPGMDGHAVCRRIRDSHPAVRVILSSGFPVDGDTAGCLTEHEIRFLQKPYQRTQLISAVRDLMDLRVTGAEAAGAD
jgi:CheY-like chemotaxis protein